jgi:hypothetical protein
MAIRDDFTAGEVLAAADLNDTFASKVPYAYGTATPSTTVDGFVWFDENSTPPAPKFWDGAAFQGIGGGKILQVVRATDTTQRSTTSTSFVDVTGMSVTITPQKSTSAVLLISTFMARTDVSGDYINTQITDSSNNAIWARSQSNFLGAASPGNLLQAPHTLIAYATPATTSPVTFKLRFKSNGGNTVVIRNDINTGQLYAIEVRMITTQQAVASLRPGVEWSMNGDDVEGITWHTEGAEPLTTAEVQAEIKRLREGRGGQD